MSKNEASMIKDDQSRLDDAKSYAEVWSIVKDTVESVFHKKRSSMMLFLDDLPLQLGAYHPLGTNNIVLNRTLVQLVEASIESKPVVNALVFNLLVHEYLHALGEYSEEAVHNQVIQVTRKCFGKEHIASQIAVKSPWSLLKGIPLQGVNARKRIMEIVKDFEESGKYIV